MPPTLSSSAKWPDASSARATLLLGGLRLGRGRVHPGGSYGDAAAAVTRRHPRRIAAGGAAGAALVGEGLAQPAYGRLAVDLAAALPTEPGHPDHRHRGDDDGWHQPQQDLHLTRVGTPRSSMCEARLRRPDPLLAAVGEALVLPDRDLGLEGVDQVPGRVERLTRGARRPRRPRRRRHRSRGCRRGAPPRRRGRGGPRRPDRRSRASCPAPSGGRSSRDPRRPCCCRDRGPGRRTGSPHHSRLPPRSPVRRRRRAGSPGSQRGGRAGGSRLDTSPPGGCRFGVPWAA